ncbi:MAG: hypothetical protein GQ527_03365, partial [Bacteroidales bacterium]|nr:hypothetical protein [Bacteroidales bacterium]
MQSEVRTHNKQNSFGIQKVQLRIDQLDEKAKLSYSQAQTLLVSAKNSNTSNQIDLLAQANQKFDEAQKVGEEVAELKIIKQEMQNADSDSKNIVDQLNKKSDDLSNAISDGNWEQVNTIYLAAEKDYNNHRVIVDFTDRVDIETAELVDTEQTQAEFVAYQLSTEGNIIKTYGSPQDDWSSYDSFTKDALTQTENRNLVLSPNVNLESDQGKFVNIFKPAQVYNGEDISLSDIKIDTELRNSDFSLVENTISQIENLKTETAILISKRNAINKYYQKSIVEAKSLDVESLKLLEGTTFTNNIIQNANKLSVDSKEVLWKASVAATLIKKYEESIKSHTDLITEAIKTGEEIQNYSKNNNQDEALLLNVQLQRKIVALNAQEIDDRSFNYAVGEIFVETPEIFALQNNQEFVVENGQVQRNDHAEINQLFYQNSTQSLVDLSSVALVVSASTIVLQDHIINTNTSTANLSERNNSSNPPNNKLINEEIDIQSYDVSQMTNQEDIRSNLAELNQYSQQHISEIQLVSDALIVLAESKLTLSNEKSLEAESHNLNTEKKKALDESKEFLYQAMAVKSIAEEYEEFSKQEKEKQDKITETTFQIEAELERGNLEESKVLFQQMQTQVQQFGNSGSIELELIQQKMEQNSPSINRNMDSAYAQSQTYANESVELLSNASEIRDNAEGRKNAFKRREMLKEAEDLEILATEKQNKSEKALLAGNEFYQKTMVLLAAQEIQTDLSLLSSTSLTTSPIVVNQAIVFNGIENRKEEVLEGKLNTAAQTTQASAANVPMAETDDVHVYERESYKAEMISEELEIIKREIALLVKADQSDLTEREVYVIENQIKQLREKSDSLDYQANRAFEFANRILNTLSEEDQKELKKKGRDFNDYLEDLKNKIELLLSEASSLKQRAQRSNNITLREDLYNQAKEKEEVAMYLILEEFEVIAQKNKTRYRKNQLILQQLLMETASPQERELMMNIFSQIDSYFDQASEKRRKANEAGVSFNMRKILLQDAYSLEMKALDMQQQAQNMLKKHDTRAMLAMQSIKTEADDNLMAQNEETQTDGVLIDNNVVNQESKIAEISTVLIPLDSPERGNIYKVQFLALRELKTADYFSSGITEITAERVPNTNFVRYFSGSFTDIECAMIRRNNLRSSGYPDAFIKSWKNGESISLLGMAENTNRTNVNLTASSTTQSLVNNIDFSATNISSLSGVYYTVQVGVYSRPRTSAMIFGISPLYHKRLANGYWVYYSGIFKSIADANLKKDEIVTKGVSDAFIVAYSDGQAVSFSKARQDLNRGSNPPEDTDIVIIEDASLQ